MEIRIRISVILMVGFLIVVSGAANGEDNDDGPGSLQTVIYTKGDAQHQLTLWWQRQVPLFTEAELTVLKQSGVSYKDLLPNYRSIIFFILTDSAVGHPEKNRIVWLGIDSIAQYRKEWIGNIAWSSGGDQVFVTLVQDLFPVIDMKVYTVDLLNTIEGHVPLEFTVPNNKVWQSNSAEPVAELRTHLASVVPGDYLCSISWFKTVPVRDRLLIYGERKGKKCNPVYLVLDLKTKVFSIGILQEKELKQNQGQTNP